MDAGLGVRIRRRPKRFEEPACAPVAKKASEKGSHGERGEKLEHQNGRRDFARAADTGVGEGSFTADTECFSPPAGNVYPRGMQQKLTRGLSLAIVALAADCLRESVYEVRNLPGPL
jgi:hypothetical protein